MVRLKNRREISSCQIKTSRKRNLAKILCRKQKRGGYKRRVWEVYIMANLFSILFIILVAIVGGIPTIVITGYIPVMIAQKIYRKVKYGYSLYR
jgi:hypothetical protein